MIECPKCGRTVNLWFADQEKRRHVTVKCPWDCGNILYAGSGFRAGAERFTPHRRPDLVKKYEDDPPPEAA